MRKDRIVTNFQRLTRSDKVSKGRQVSTEMRANPTFGDTDVTYDQLDAATDKLEKSMVAAASGGKEETALMNQAEVEWDKTMRLMGRYVERVADGDGAVMLSSGFDLAKQPNPSQRAEFSAEHNGKPGSVILKRRAVEGAKSYLWQMSSSPLHESDNDWKLVNVTTQATIEITGLTPLSKYWFRGAVVTKDGTSAFCAPVMQVVV